VQGISLGAAAGILAAARRPEIQGVVAESLFGSLSGAIATGFTAITGAPSFPFAPLAAWIGEYRLGIDVDDVAPAAVIRRISPRPVFLIHDLQDRQLPKESAEALLSAAGEPKQLWHVPGAAHGRGWQQASEEYERRTVAFWRNVLDAPD
jgi:uncharacterized protein